MSGSKAKGARRLKENIPGYLAVERVMIRDDVDWVHSTIQAVEGTVWSGPLGIALAPQMARIVHEGYDYLLRKRPAVAKTLEKSLAAQVATARHTIKLVDDKFRDLEDVLGGFRTAASNHNNYFAHGRNLALGFWNNQLFYTSRSAEYQTLASVHAINPYDTSKQIGGALAVLLQQGLGVAVPPPTRLHAPDDGSFTAIDETAAEFYPSAYSLWLSEAEKDLLMTAEATLTAFALCEKIAGAEFAGPVFRGRLVAFFHAVNAVKAVISEHEGDQAEVPRAIMEALTDYEAQWILNQSALRNRAMHYGIPPSMTGIAIPLPMYGIVEAATQTPFAIVQRQLRRTSALLTTALASWRGAASGGTVIV